MSSIITLLTTIFLSSLFPSFQFATNTNPNPSDFFCIKPIIAKDYHYRIFSIFRLYKNLHNYQITEFSTFIWRSEAINTQESKATVFRELDQAHNFQDIQAILDTMLEMGNPLQSFDTTYNFIFNTKYYGQPVPLNPHNMPLRINTHFIRFDKNRSKNNHTNKSFYYIVFKLKLENEISLHTIQLNYNYNTNKLKNATWTKFDREDETTKKGYCYKRKIDTENAVDSNLLFNTLNGVIKQKVPQITLGKNERYKEEVLMRMYVTDKHHEEDELHEKINVGEPVFYSNGEAEDNKDCVEIIKESRQIEVEGDADSLSPLDYFVEWAQQDKKFNNLLKKMLIVSIIFFCGIVIGGFVYFA